MMEGMFSVLSPEIRLEVFSFLFENKDEMDWQSVVRAMRVNKLWKDDIEFLWYQFCKMHKLLVDESWWFKKGKNWKWLCLCRLTPLVENSKGKTFGWAIKNEQHYEGEYFEDQKNGIGCMWWGEDRYIGEWEHGNKTGHGLMLWGNGDVYDGQWQKELRHGSAIYYYQNGGKYDGGYELDDRNGKGVFTWPDGDYYVGTWRVGGRIGTGVFFNRETGQMIQQEWDESPSVNYSREIPPKFPPGTSTNALPSPAS